jgi:hypothetical protein
MAWYTITTAHSALGEERNSPQLTFERLWLTALFRSPEAGLFAGSLGPRGLRHYLVVPEAGEDMLQDFLRIHRAEQLDGIPDDTDVQLLVAHKSRAMELWEALITCSWGRIRRGV